jgi:Protein of unknown function (DUF1499)
MTAKVLAVIAGLAFALFHAHIGPCYGFIATAGNAVVLPTFRTASLVAPDRVSVSTVRTSTRRDDEAEHTDHWHPGIVMRRALLFRAAQAVTTVAATLICGAPGTLMKGAHAQDPTGDFATTTEACPIRDPPNCVSSASVKAVSLYIPPWTYPPEMSDGEVLARLKGIVSTDAQVQSIDVNLSGKSVRATIRRNSLATDEISFHVNSVDHIITLCSLQIDGVLSVNDFGAQRQRINDYRQKASGVFQTMGAAEAEAGFSQQEGALGQLKAFYGYRSGTGFEDILLD